MDKKIAVGICFLVLCFSTAFCGLDSLSQKLNTEFSGYTYIEAGEVVKGTNGNNEAYDHRWMEDACFGLFSNSRIDEHLQVLMGFEGQLTYPFNINAIGVVNQGQGHVAQREIINNFWVSRGEGLYSFGDPTGTSLQIEAGYFPYKYNSEVRNLGEYLFRTYCYPPTMVNKFDRTFTELLGFRIGNTLGGIFHHDLIFYSETKLFPYNDFSLAYLADLKTPAFNIGSLSIRNILTLGGGINFYRLIPVRGDLTTPNNTAYLPNNYYDSTHVKTSTGADSAYPSDSGFISYAGTKVMGRITLDLKGFFPEDFANIFGPEDLKLYSELAILGLKNYPVYYENMSERMPITFGINWPTFKVLDLINTEIEYSNAPYPNSLEGPYYNLTPSPLPARDHQTLKWSVYAKKYIGTRLSFSMQVANDHLMPQSLSPEYVAMQDYTDVTLVHGDWWWNFRARFDF